MTIVRAHPDCRFIVFCDDLSFDHDDTSYKSLKAALEGREILVEPFSPGEGLIVAFIVHDGAPVAATP